MNLWILFKNWIKEDMGIVLKGKLAFLTTLVIAFSLAYRASFWRYAGIIEKKDEIIKILEERILGIKEKELNYKEELLKNNQKLQQNTSTTVTNLQESNKIYQDNKVVGEITGKVKITGDYIIFKELIETHTLKRELPFEYQEVKYIIKKIESFSGILLDGLNAPKQSVMNNVLCENEKFK